VNETDLDAEDFLELLWGDDEGWIEMPAKVNGYWIPWQHFWPPRHDTNISLRIDQCLHDEEDLYYSVAKFREKGRNIEHVMPTEWLWADLDQVHPSEATKMGFMPTFAIESSPGRYQALWRLTKRLKPQVTEKLNRGLTYALGADRGGWDLTQVLRVPGTRNFKYPGAPRVRLLWYGEDLIYPPRDVWAAVQEHVPAEELKGATGMVLPKRKIPRKAQQLLLTAVDEVVTGERSARLWELECLLAEAGCTAEEIYDLVVDTVWNKWRGQHGMRGRLMRDVTKAVRYVTRKAISVKQEARQGVKADDGAESSDADARADRLPFIKLSSFTAMEMKEVEWLVEDIWAAGSHGIIGGEPKTSKTTLALALGLSVASGADFLGRYPCGDPGPVLIVQEENAPWLIQDRLLRLTREMSVRGEVPMWVLNNYGFDLSREEHRDMLEAYVDEVRPRLLILDPLYLIFGPINASAMDQLQPFLKWIIQLRYTYGCAVAVVHHMGKQSEGTAGRRAGQRLIGSATLHGFTDSALYTSRVDDLRKGWTRVLIEREFRSMEPQEAIEMAWHFDKPGTLGMQMEIESKGPEQQILDFVKSRDRTTVKQIVEATGFNIKTVRRYIDGSQLLGVDTNGRGRTQWVRVLNGDHPQ